MPPPISERAAELWCHGHRRGQAGKQAAQLTLGGGVYEKYGMFFRQVEGVCIAIVFDVAGTGHRRQVVVAPQWQYLEKNKL